MQERRGVAALINDTTIDVTSQPVNLLKTKKLSGKRYCSNSFYTVLLEVIH
jgi:hypothetical protein